MEEKVKLIGEIDFKDLKVPVYYDPSGLNTIAWQIRNPDICYKGYLLMSLEGKITYPEGAVIPKQTDRDREIMPKVQCIL
jgi:hypothetical protein